MQDNDSGSERRSGWEPPEYVSPWASSSNADDASDADGAPGSGDTIAFGPGSSQPGYPQYGYPQPGYQQPGQQQPWLGQPTYSQPGYGPPGQGGYGAWGGGPGNQYQWGGYGAPPPPQGSRFGRFLAYVAVAALAAGVGAGAAIALNHSAGSPPAASSAPANTNPGGSNTNPGNTNPGGTNGGNGFPFNGNNPGFGQQPGQNGSTNSGSGPLNARTLAGKVDPGLVDVVAQLKYNSETAEGTGMVISSNGLVLTNNHVIDQATSVSATLVVSGKTYTARVVGYDDTDDVALLQLEGASGLKTVSLGDSSQVKVGQSVLAIGNAGGVGGLPSTAQGTINGLNRTIQASDNGESAQETLHGMLQTNAPIQEGDSGGPLVNSAGRVIGMDTAADTSSNFGQSSVATTGFAIPIDHAVTIADEIANGQASAAVHIGLGGFIGIQVADPDSGCQGAGGLGISSPVSSGALICEVIKGTPADSAGLVSGDVITSVNGQAVTTANGLTSVLAGEHPGDQLSVVYVDSNGNRHTTTVTLTAMAR